MFFSPELNEHKNTKNEEKTQKQQILSYHIRIGFTVIVSTFKISQIYGNSLEFTLIVLILR